MFFNRSIFPMLLVSTSAYAAGDNGGLNDALRGIADDLATLQKEIQTASASAEAQQIAAGTRAIQFVTITKDNAALKYGADENASSYSKASAGQTFKVLDKANDWYAVQLEKPAKGIDSAWVNAADVAPKFQYIGNTQAKDSSVADKLYQQIMESVKKVKDKYDKNPYVSVSGFSVDVGIPPSVSVSFEFNK